MYCSRVLECLDNFAVLFWILTIRLNRLHIKVNLILRHFVGRRDQIEIFSKENGMSLIKRLTSDHGLRIQPRLTPLAYGKGRLWQVFMEHVEFEYKLFIKLKKSLQH